MADEKIVIYYKDLPGNTHHKYALYHAADGSVKGYARLGASGIESAKEFAGKYTDDGFSLGKLYGFHDDGTAWGDQTNPDSYGRALNLLGLINSGTPLIGT